MTRNLQIKEIDWMMDLAENERCQRDDFKMLNTTTESRIYGFSSHLDEVEPAITKLESMDNVVSQVSLELQSVKIAWVQKFM